MTPAIGLPPPFLTAIWAFRIARVLDLDEVRDHQPEPGCLSAPGIGFCSCIDLMGPEELLVLLGRTAGLTPPASP